MFYFKGGHPLVDQEYFGQSVVGGFDGSAALDNGTNLKFHRWIGGCSSELGVFTELTIHLIARLIGIAVQIGETDRRGRDDQRLTVGLNRYLRNNGASKAASPFENPMP